MVQNPGHLRTSGLFPVYSEGRPLAGGQAGRQTHPLKAFALLAKVLTSSPLLPLTFLPILMTSPRNRVTLPGKTGKPGQV